MFFCSLDGKEVEMDGRMLKKGLGEGSPYLGKEKKKGQFGPAETAPPPEGPARGLSPWGVVRVMFPLVLFSWRTVSSRALDGDFLPLGCSGVAML